MTGATADALTRLAGSALAEVDQLARGLIDSIAAELPELTQDARVRELFEATVLDNAVTALRVLTGGDDEIDTTAPPVALEFARRLAQQGVPITVMLRAYRLGQAAFQQEIITRIGAENLSAHEVATASLSLSTFAFTYIDTTSEQVVAAYQLERDSWLRHRNANRLAKVQAALSGKSADADDVGRALGFPLTTRHVGAVLWCGQDADEPDRLARLERQVSRLATALHTPWAPLFVAPDASTIWAWFPITDADVGTVTSRLEEPDETIRVSFGEPAVGLAGFRTTHQQARQAQSLALAADPAVQRAVTAYGELGPLALVAAEVPAIGTWVQSVLGALADDDEGSARMRDTIWAYLYSGSSLNTAAAELHLHKNTIQYRIRKAEDARGRPLSDGRIDVEVALLACRVLGAAVLRRADAGGG